ncbi:PREDICTED: WAT1-related protein At5g40210-like [Tarenaya hassleriana]|uniref:WAT1-related protein At5g40210-like n=1 Tax=Tarenaya hassleriana TaxID=28532 RepID=UPI00053C7B38|nr:PREDICTED: WAT1-related protein At5g40210-like [Tarenaya hassleriana]
MAGMICSKDFAIFAAMVSTEISNVGLNVLFKAATSKGMSSSVFLVYSFAIGALLLLPFTFFSCRSRLLPPLSFSILSKIGVLGLLGCLYNTLGYKGVRLSSPTLASAMSNLTPAFTFILAVIFRMEKVAIKKGSSMAKVAGTLVCISGALVATLYHGPPVFVASQPSDHLRRTQPLPRSSNSDWVMGGGLSALSYTLVSVAYIVQAQVLREYPSESIVTQFYAAFASMFSAWISCFTEKNNPSAWIIQSKLSLACIVAAGILNPGNFLIHSWVVRCKGPVFVAMFRPLSILIAVVMGAIFLGDSLYLGSLVGGALISAGFYTVMWGKAKEDKAEAEPNSPEKASILADYHKEQI